MTLLCRQPLLQLQRQRQYYHTNNSLATVSHELHHFFLFCVVFLSGFLGSAPHLHLLTFLDAGEAPPTDHSTKRPMSAAAIALIVVGIIVAVALIVAFVSFIVVRQRRWKMRAGRGGAYTTIPEQ